MSERVEDEFAAVEACYGEDFRRIPATAQDSAAIAVKITEGVCIRIQVPPGYPRVEKLTASVHEDLSYRGLYVYKDLNKALSSFVEEQAVDEEMILTLLDHAHDLVLEMVPPVAKQSEPEINILDHSGPSPPFAGGCTTDPEPVQGGGWPFFTIGKQVRVVGEHAPFKLKGQVGTLKYFEKCKGKWWVQFPKSTASNLHGDAHMVHHSDMVLLQEEVAFEHFKQDMSEAVQASLASFGDEDLQEQVALAQQASLEMAEAAEEAQLTQALRESCELVEAQ